MIKKNFEVFRNIFNKEEIKYLIIIYFSILIITILDIFSFALIIPVFNFIFFNKIPSVLNFINLNDLNNNFDIWFKIYILLALLVIFSLKNLIIIGFNFFYLNIYKKINIRIEKELFFLFINQDYSFFLKKNSDNFLQKIIHDCKHVCSGLQNLTIVFIEIIFLFGLSVLLIFSNFKIFIFSFSIFILTLFFYVKIFKKRIKRWGVENRNANSKSSQMVQEGINGLKDIIIYNLKEKFEKNYNSCVVASNHASTRLFFLNNIQKYWMETFGFISIIIALIYFIFGNFDINKLVPVFGLFTVAMFRLLSSINRIVVNLQSFKFVYPSFEALSDTIQYLKKANNIKLNEIYSLNESIELKNVSFEYSNDTSKILNNISLKIHKGDLICIIGNNGTGKTTFLNLISGLLVPKSGSIIIDNKYNILNNTHNWVKNLSYVQQNIFLLNSSIKNNITLTDDDKINYDRYNYLIKILDLKNYFKGLINFLDTEVGFNGINLSGGQKQMISLARALYKDSELIIFDEPTSSFDENKSRLFKNIILSLKRKKTIIVVTHEKKLLNEDFDKIFEIQSGNLVLIKY
jgi:ABC-type multidrug transport system fused ATPase/permease subunit